MSDTPSLHDGPDLPQDSAPRLGVPGTPEFFASILSFIRLTAPGVPLDTVIFQSIILSIMAGNRHVLLRTRDEDITIVQNLASLVSNVALVSSVPSTRARDDHYFLFPTSLTFLTMTARYSPTYLVTQLTDTR